MTTCATASPPCSPRWTWPPARSAGSIHRRRRATEFKRFLTTLDKRIPADLDVHLICDNYATHKTPTITTWLAAHPRFHMHHTPTYSSWLNQVERWFALLDRQETAPWRTPVNPGPGERHSRLDHQLQHNPNPSHGPRPPTRSSNASTHIFNEFLAQDTSEASPLTAERWGLVRRLCCGQAVKMAAHGDDQRCARRACGARYRVSGSDLPQRLCAESADGRAGGVVSDPASGQSDTVAGDLGEDRHRVSPRGGVVRRGTTGSRWCGSPGTTARSR